MPVPHPLHPLSLVINLTKTHNWVEWTAPSVSLSQTKVNDINLNDRPRMQNDTENEIGRSLFPRGMGAHILIVVLYSLKKTIGTLVVGFSTSFG